MEPGKVEKYLLKKRAEDGALLFTVIDPMDYSELDGAIAAAKAAASAGADLIVVGGSTGVQGQALDYTVDIPVNLFPGNIGTVNAKADSIYFMSMLNSRNTYWISEAQMLGAPVVKRLGIEPLPTAYLVVGDGGTVAWVGDAKPIPLNKPKIAAAMALSAQMMGFRFVLTDAGSNPPEPVPPQMIAAVRAALGKDTFYIAAGGIRSESQVRAAIVAGADAVQIGTAFENAKDVEKMASKLVAVVKKEGKKRL